MKAWLHAGLLDVRVLPEVARAAEAAGFHGLALSDHVLSPRELRSPYPYGAEPPPADAHYPDTWVTIAALAAITSRLRFVSKVYLPAARHPIVVARAVGTAAVLSGGRVCLGVGAGWMAEEFAIMGVDFRTRGARLDEHLTVLRKLWGEGWAEHHGEHYDFPPLRLSPRPEHPIPIYGGGEAPVALRRAARLDGWLGAAYELDTVADLVGRLAAARRELGIIDRRDYEVMVGLPRVPSLDDWRRLEELGVTSVSVAPWLDVDHRGQADELVSAIDRFAEAVLRRV